MGNDGPVPKAGAARPSGSGLVGRVYLERGQPVTVLARWGDGGGPRNVLILRDDGSRVVRPFRGLRRPRSVEASPVSSRAANSHTGTNGRQRQPERFRRSLVAGVWRGHGRSDIASEEHEASGGEQPDRPTEKAEPDHRGEREDAERQADPASPLRHPTQL